MRIIFDHQIFAVQRYGGISRYIARLVEQFASRPDLSPRVIAPFYVNAYLDALPPALVRGRAVSAGPLGRRLAPRIDRLIAPALVRRSKPDLVHETYYGAHRSGAKGTPAILTVHDMIHEKFADHFPASDHTRDLKRLAVLRASHIVCVSENTRRDLIEIIPEAEGKTSVTRLGFDSFARPTAGSTSPEACPYLLYVGDRRGYKNFQRLLQAYAASSLPRNGIALLCFGGGRFDRDEVEAISGLGLDQRHVRQTAGDDAQLGRYYGHAAAFIYPSLYEGFGIPPLEAMSAGCPVLCSDRSSIPEVCGDAAHYFDPEAVDAIRHAMERIVEHPGYRAELVARGDARLTHFSWEQCAAQTLDVYRQFG